MEESKEITTTTSSCASTDLVTDVFHQILMRVSLNTLNPCREVCKDWLKLTHESYFANLQTQNSNGKIVSGYYIQCLKPVNRYTCTYVSKNPTTSSLDLKFLPTNYYDATKIVASSSQGFLCCVTQSRIPRYYVCKPTTKEWRKIANPKTRYFTVSMAMVVRTNPLNFIIVRLSSLLSCFSSHLQCEIYLSKYNKWKKSKDIKLPSTMYLPQGSAVSSNGALHWLTNEDCIFAFNYNQENWTLLSLPEEATMNTNNRKQLVKYEHKLALLSMGEEWMELWVMQNYAKRLWNKRLCVKLNPIVGNNELVDLYTSDVAFARGFCKVMWYNYINNSHTEVDTKFPITHLDEIFPFYSDSEYSFLGGDLSFGNSGRVL
ncbi:F-box protein [Thalictrum thalictroides]|uniref:F-box protein n=1 Tax=Thalictrum thalictroides TaxID=46969 RepID=A0A7J6WZP6_THATH|nr:F-box protein [Thalictrum thalictroides]